MEPAARRTFLEQYGAIRHAERRGSHDPAWYRALPYQDLSGANSAQWAIRARSYRHFENRILPRLERATARPLRILDLGAGNGWMSYRLSLRGHRCVALDIFADPLDGLSAIHNYPMVISAVVAEFDSLPFRTDSFDLAIYNSSLHYSADYCRTIAELKRCLRRPGRFFVIDSPVYKLPDHGRLMREERQAQFERAHGFRSEAAGSIEYLDEPALARISAELGIKWKRTLPWHGWKWALRPLRARFKGARPPSQFFILEGRFQGR
jgi:ubiquinone/menaquinone biosynthesis C-methylase UbiE